MVVNFANRDGSVSEQTIHHYAGIAKGGAALIIVEATSITQGGRSSPYQLIMYKDEFIPTWRRLVDAVHEQGAKISVELCHCGRQGKSIFTGEQPVGPSPVRLEREGWETPRELSIEEIEILVEEFADASRRAKEAGFDAVEIHATHGYLLSTFISPAVNQRTDRYGGDIAGRARFTTEVVQRTKEKLGHDYPVLVRINGADFIPGGLTLEEACILSRLLEEAGADCIDVSAGSYEAIGYDIPPSSMEPGCVVYLAEAIKRHVNVPVIAVGRINTPALGDQILRENRADLVAMGRSLIADPDLPKKAREGRREDIRICTACRECLDKIFEKVKIACSVNAAFGNEAEYSITPTKNPKKILVAGGGPAGMEAARVAALRGHKVVLYEEGASLGGQLLMAGVPPHKDGLRDLREFLVTQTTKLGVEIHLGRKVTPELITEVRPDVVIAATGAVYRMPEIPGVNLGNVCTFCDVLTGKIETGERVVVVGGGRVGCETAELLHNRGRKVTILEMLDKIGADMGQFTKEDVLPRLRTMGIQMEVKTRVEKITSDGVLAKSEGKSVHFKADTIVLATGSTSQKDLAGQLEGKVPELLVIGDCVEPRNLMNAIHEGYRAGLKV